MASTIWQSWKPAIDAYPLPSYNGNIGEGVEWLGKGFVEAASIHLESNFGGYFFGKYLPFIPSFPFTLYCYVAVYYIVTRMQTIDLGLNTLKPNDNVGLSNILLMQFFFMLPMFTVLSTDGSRTIPYWIVSSLFFYHFFGKKTMAFPTWLTRFSIRAQAWIDSKPCLNNPWVYFVIIVTIPLQLWGHSSITCYYPPVFRNGVTQIGLRPFPECF